MEKQESSLKSLRAIVLTKLIRVLFKHIFKSRSSMTNPLVHIGIYHSCAKETQAVQEWCFIVEEDQSYQSFDEKYK